MVGGGGGGQVGVFIFDIVCAARAMTPAIVQCAAEHGGRKNDSNCTTRDYMDSAEIQSETNLRHAPPPPPPPSIAYIHARPHAHYPFELSHLSLNYFSAQVIKDL